MYPVLSSPNSSVPHIGLSEFAIGPKNRLSVSASCPNPVLSSAPTDHSRFRAEAALARNSPENNVIYFQTLPVGHHYSIASDLRYLCRRNDVDFSIDDGLCKTRVDNYDLAEGRTGKLDHLQNPPNREYSRE
jgi:hypothetical protein